MSRLSISDIRSLNKHLSSQTNLTAVFVGATNGIGLGILEAFTRHIPAPRAIVLGRSKEAFASKLKKLEQINPKLDLTFIETDVSLLKNVDRVSAEIKGLVPQINLLFLSAGYINFGARDENEEGFDKCQALRYHTRLRFVTNLLPLLSAPQPRVVSILAGGQEGELDFDDLELRKTGRYSIVRAGGHAAAMTTLAFEKLAKENPQVGFIHAYPGLVKSNVLANSVGKGVLGMLVRWFVQPLLGFFAISIEESGERILCYATSETIAGPAVSGHESVRLAKPTVEGCWTLNRDGKAAGNEKLLSKLRSEDGEKKVWNHTITEWKRVLG